MPVLSAPTGSSSLPGLDLPYAFLGGSLLLVLGVLISRKSKSKSKSSPRNMSHPPVSEKPSPQSQEPYISNASAPLTFPQHHHPRPPPPLPFTPPTLSTTIFPAPIEYAPGSDSQTSSPGGGGGLNQSYYDSPTTLEFEYPFDSTPSSPEPAVLSKPNSETGTDDLLPRRRSYTKTHSTSSTSSTLSTGSVTITGEVIQAEGWRRHTRVFGGGVCKACEESEKKMSA
jgi:hypothetical protein